MKEETRAPYPCPPIGLLSTIAMVLGCIAIAPAAAEPMGYTARLHQLLILNFADGESAVVGAPQPIRYFSLALGPDDRLLGAGIIVPPIDPNAPHLWEVDRQTGELTVVGSPIGEGIPGDMTFDAAGNLWMTIGGILFAVDPVTGARTEIGGTGLVGLEARDGVLYGLRAAGVCSDWDLVTLDPTTGDAISIAPLPLFDSDAVCDTDMSVDEDGALWVLARSDTAVPIPIEFPHALYRFEDPVTGVPERIHDLGILEARGGLAVIPPEGTVAIPTLGSFGFICLILTLALAGWGVLRVRATGQNLLER